MFVCVLNPKPYTLKPYTPNLNRMAVYLYVFFGMCLYAFLACVFVCVLILTIYLHVFFGMCLYVFLTCVFVCVFVCLYVFWCFASSARVNEPLKKKL